MLVAVDLFKPIPGQRAQEEPEALRMGIRLDWCYTNALAMCSIRASISSRRNREQP